MTSPKMYAVIMAGGRGTRFWPLSRRNRPKQLLNIIGDQSMLQMTIDRLRKIKFVEDIIIVTGADLADAISGEIEGVSKANIIVEPTGKNTASSIALAAVHLMARNSEACMGVFPADHVIVGHRSFSSCLSAALKLASSGGLLATLGIVPSSPHTGYGYIQFDKKQTLDAGRAFAVKTFAEKPTMAAAKRFLKSGDFLWNSGMFVWKAGVFLDAMKEHMPVHHEIIAEIGDSVGTDDYRSTLEAKWDSLSSQSVDYGLLEKASNICVIKSEFTWSDVGSWNAYFDLLPKNSGGNVVKGDGVVIEGSGNLVHSNGRLTAVMGLDDVAVINTEDATLVVPRDRVEEIKRVVSILEKSGRDTLL